MTENRVQARQLANEAVDRGEPLQWFETLYSQAAGEQSAIPWADMVANPNLVDWLDKHQINGTNRKALVVGGGLGDDAEALASLGFQVTSFDISPSCIDWCKRRFPESTVEYLVADLFHPSEEWSHAFGFIFEAYTLQVLPPKLRHEAIQKIANWVAPAGTLLVIARGRDETDGSGNMPWPLIRDELSAFVESGLNEEQFEDYIEAENPPVRRFRVEYSRGKLSECSIKTN